MKKALLSITAVGILSTAIGQTNHLSGTFNYNDPLATGTTFGTTTAKYSSSLGRQNVVLGNYSSAFGRFNSVNENFSYGMGKRLTSNGKFSYSFGHYLTTEGNFAFSFGKGEDHGVQFINPHSNSFAVGFLPGAPAFYVRLQGTKQRVGIGTFSPLNKLHIMTNDNEGISMQTNLTSQRSNIRFLDQTGTLNWNITAYNDFVGGYGNILEVNSHKGGNFWVRNTTMMVGDFFNFDACVDCNDYLLFVRKGIRTEEVKVDIASGVWADYVFEDDYNLLPLEEVATYIEENGHLPNVPSAATVEEEGVRLGEMDAKMLEKIEELTLYILQQEERIKQLEKTLLEQSNN